MQARMAGSLSVVPRKPSELWQNFIGVVHEGLEADAHGVDSQVGAPALGVALLLPVDLADIGGLFAGCGRLPETLKHGILALEDFFHVSLHEENPVVKRFRFGVCFPKLPRQAWSVVGPRL